MAKRNWNALQVEYIKSYAKTGISIMEWCKKKGINFATAKRYIKKPETVFSQQKNSETKCETAKDKNSYISKGCENNCENSSEIEPKTAKPSAKDDEETAKQLAFSQLQSQRRTVHGGYARYFKDKSAFDVVKDFSLEDEIDLMRQRAISAIESVERFTADLAKCATAEDKEITFKLIKSAEAALDRAVARIESLNNTNKNIALTLETIELRKAQTQETLLKADKLKQELSTKSSARNAVLFNLEL